MPSVFCLPTQLFLNLSESIKINYEFFRSNAAALQYKKYNASKKIKEVDIQSLKEILRLSPSSINSQPWKFTFVRDQKTKEKLSKVSWINTEKVLDCDTLIVLSRIDNLEVFENQIKEELPEAAVNYYNETVKIARSCC